MENPKAQLVARIKESNNVLVTVSINPSVDQLAGAIGLTLLLNKIGKHGTAVFSGKVPSTIEFLKPEETLEKNTDSLRDFIIALDKSKADKLRYKVEEDHVKIFITPYHTSISEKDLEFSQGDFNVDVVIALGVHQQKELDQAITTHGRILHDATVASINTKTDGNLGTINWVDNTASSLCEMLASLAEELQTDNLDAQMATAFLTGIVAETERFSNVKTTAITMGLSSKLMAAGANQQLVATKLQEKPASDNLPKEMPQESDSLPPLVEENQDALQINHDNAPLPFIDDIPEVELPTEDEATIPNKAGERKTLKPKDEKPEPKESLVSDGSKLILEPPTMGGKLTANTESDEKPMNDPLGVSSSAPILSHDEPAKTKDSKHPKAHKAELPEPEPDEPKETEQLASPLIDTDLPSVSPPPITPPQPPTPPAIDNTQTPKLEDTIDKLEEKIDAGYVPAETVPDTSLKGPLLDIDKARDAVVSAVDSSPSPLQPPVAFNSQPMNLDLGHDNLSPPPAIAGLPPIPSDHSLNVPQTGLPPNLPPPDTVLPQNDNNLPADNSTPPPPPVPPPMTPFNFTPPPDDNQQNPPQVL